MNWVANELSAGRLSIGDHLPSERALAETLDVSRSSIREALRVLDALGTIRSSTGSGPKSGTVITAEPEQALTLALNLQIATKQVEHHHVYQMRLLLETWAMENADAAAADWSKPKKFLDLMDDEALSHQEFLRLDAQFHVAMSRAANNPLASTLMDSLRTVIEEHTVGLAEELPNWASTKQRLRAEHRAIFEAARDGQVDRAATLIREHISGYYAESSGAAQN